jgi:hypothetical protein
MFTEFMASGSGGGEHQCDIRTVNVTTTNQTISLGFKPKTIVAFGGFFGTVGSTNGIGGFVYDENNATTGALWFKSMDGTTNPFSSYGSDYVVPTTNGYTIKAPNSNWAGTYRVIAVS